MPASPYSATAPVPGARHTGHLVSGVYCPGGCAHAEIAGFRESREGGSGPLPGAVFKALRHDELSRERASATLL